MAVRGAAVWPESPSLRRDGEPWTGHFPGLGRIEVWADGRHSVTAEPDPVEPAALRERALLHGWAEPLSWTRRGYHLFWGAGVIRSDEPTCLLLAGDPHDVGLTLMELSARGWRVLSDLLTPVTWDEEGLVAFPRATPVAISSTRAARHGITGTPLRRSTDTVEVALPMHDRSARVGAIATVRPRKVGEVTLESLFGHRRFEAAAAYLASGVLWPGDTPESGPRERFASQVRLSSLPAARIGLDPGDPSADIASLVDWWSTQAASGE